MRLGEVRLPIALMVLLAGAAGAADDTQMSVANPPTATALECSVKATTCAFSGCSHDVSATNNSAADLPAGYTVRATVTYEVNHLTRRGSPTELKTETLEKVLPQRGLVKGKSISVGEFTVAKTSSVPAACEANAAP